MAAPVDHSTGANTKPVLAVAPDRDGSLWYISQEALMHWYPNGSVTTVIDKWQEPNFEPVALALGTSGEIWVGGLAGGIYRVAVAGTAIQALEHIGAPTILSDVVDALMVDRRGWVWAATDRGVSVFDRQKWRSIDIDSGLIWNDTSQNGLYEDEDGSVWISTSRGLSHLINPRTLFKLHPIQALISSLDLGDQNFPRRAVSYTTSPLVVNFGTSSFRAERSIVFRYRLDGVDTDWATSSSGYVRYPFVPSGHHLLTVSAFDSLTGEESAAVNFTIRIEKPWWASWPMWMFYVTTSVLILCAAFRIRYHTVLQRQHLLEKTVYLRTEEIRVAKEELALQATRDSLTGLLNRGEVQKRFATMLENSRDNALLVAALVDVDYFKRVNDVYGHLIGDEILVGISQRIRAMIRFDECVGRYGGEEMLILLTDTDGTAAARILELNRVIRSKPFAALGRDINVTCSIGVGWAEIGDNWPSLIGRIDEALYRAKRSGRDQVIEAERHLSRRTG